MTRGREARCASACFRCRPRSAARDRREEGHLPAFAQRSALVAHDLVERHAHGLAARQRARHTARRARSARRAARPASAAAVSTASLPVAQGLAHRGEVAHRDFHVQASSAAKGMNCTMSPACKGWPGRRCRSRRRPRPPRSARPNSGWRTGPARPRRCAARAGTRGACRRAASRNRRASAPAPARRGVAPCSVQQEGPHQQQEGQEARHRVAGQPDEVRARRCGRRRRACRASSTSCHRSSWPSACTAGLDVVFFADRHAAGGDDQVVRLGGARAAPRWSRRAGRARCPGRSPRSPAAAAARA